MAGIAAFLFAVHPAHIESVAWVSGVTDPLLALFYVATFWCYVRAFAHERRRFAWIAVSILLLMLALFSKEPAATFTGLVFAHAFVYSNEKFAARLRYALLYAAPFALTTMAYLIARRVVMGGLVPVRSAVSMKTMLLTAPSLLWFYVSKSILPTGVSLFYENGYVTKAFSAAFLFPTSLLLAVAGVLAYWAKRSPSERNAIVFGAAWFVITLAPAFYVRSFDSNELVHLRYSYLPSLGFCMLVAIAFRQWTGAGPRWRAEVLGGVIAVLAVLNFVQQGYWKDDYALYKRAVEIAPHHTTALNNLARVYIDRGELDRAEPILREARQLDPGYGHGLVEYNLGSIAYREGRFAEAESELRKAVARNSGDSFFHLYLGLTLFREDHLDEAEIEIRQAIALTPNRPGYHLALSSVLQVKGDLHGALDELRAEDAAVPNERVEKQIEALELQLGEHK